MRKNALRIGVCGLGRAFVLTAPALISDPRVEVVAAADPRAEARDRFAAEFGGPAYGDMSELCADPGVEVVYVASPHGLHAPQAIAAARSGKHVLVEKPMALDLAACDAMILAAKQAGVRLIVGPSHGYDAPVAQAARLIANGEFGSPRMITAMNYTDFLYRPRHAEELDPAGPGGVALNQAPHQVDIVRRLASAPARTVRAAAGTWDPSRPVEGAYNALLTFAGGASATLTYSGYGHYDSDEIQGWTSELGVVKDPRDYGLARRSLAAAHGSEGDARSARTYGRAPVANWGGRLHEHFGFVLVSCERADLRLTPRGVWIYADEAMALRPIDPPQVPRAEVIDELWGAVAEGRDPIHDGTWGRSTLEICLAMNTSSREGREVVLPWETPE